jgi:hypothetical protein
MLRWNIILIAFIIGNFISTIFLIVQSEKSNNQIGKNIGYILIIFLSIFPIGLYLVGKYLLEYYNIFFICVFGLLILFIFILLIVGLSINVNENFTLAQGICRKDGKMGYVINGECDISNTKNCEIAVQQSIEKTCPDNSKKDTTSRTKSTTNNIDTKSKTRETFAEIDGKGSVIGLCSYPFDGKIKFGFRHPDRGAACITKEQMLEEIKNTKQKPMQVNPGITHNPFQSTQCLKYPKTDYISFDIECKKKFGTDYGLKKIIENLNCAQNDYRAVCEKGWQAGAEIPANSTKCVPIGKDMNTICQLNHVNNKDKFGKYLRVGYKTIDFTGCPKGSQRAICDGNYYDGKELFEKTTAPFSQTENPNRKCQQEFGLLSFAKKINSENCAVGYVRAECN